MAEELHLYNITLMLNRASETRRLTSNSHAGAVVEVMEYINDTHAWVYAYMVMPDHIHLLFGRRNKLDDVDKFAGRIKRLINKAFSRRNLAKLHWRDGCVSYDVKLGGLKRAHDYILANPVRGQLVKSPEDWQWSGSPHPLPEGADAGEEE
ncbi:MAG: transposase [Planctomycetes bacterium]|nr:transposase [Planctomycetota bacterium]